MQVPRIMRRVNRAVTNPLVGMVAGFVPPLGIVHHKGRRSGRAYRTPVVAFATGDGFVTPLPYGTDTDWCLNVLASGHCALEAAGRKLKFENPRIVDAEAALPVLPALLRPGLRHAGLPGFLRLDRRKRVRRSRAAAPGDQSG